jgi:carboxyl-terminal processing protease
VPIKNFGFGSITGDGVISNLVGSTSAFPQAVKAGDNGFRVVTVQPDTPATAAGIRVGDLITVIDDRLATSVGQAEFGGLMRRADGTIVRLEINRDGIRHSVAVTLKELLP